MILALIIVLIVFIIAFISFLVMIRTMSLDTFIKLCQGKVKRFSKRSRLHAISDLHLTNYKREKLAINHVVFGKKYIYIITDFLLKGFVSGDDKDNSWVYYDNIHKKTHYLTNLNTILDKNIWDFAGILGISVDPIVSICLVPNECDFKIKKVESNKKIIVHFSSLNKTIRKLERLEIDSLDKEQIYEQFRTIEYKNAEERT